MPVSKKELKSQPGKISLTFKVKKEAAGNAKEVYLLFEGFGWEPEEMRLLKSGDFKSRPIFVSKDGQKSYQYRFKLVREDDSEVYDNDWKADAYVSNPFGGENSLVNIDQDLSSEKDQGPGDKED